MATLKQELAAKKIMENRGNVSKGMVEAGYSPKTAKTPKNLTGSKAWPKLMKKFLPDNLLAETHHQMLTATGVGHMVFPLEATDEQIIELLADANCIVKRFMHSLTQTHVWYFAPDNVARKAAVDMAYKLKSKYPDPKIKLGNDGDAPFRVVIEDYTNVRPKTTQNNPPAKTA
jgi:hypothetical protein